MEREDYCRGLEQLAAWLREHPEVPLPLTGSSGTHAVKIAMPGQGEDEAAALAAFARALPGRADKSFSDSGLIYVSGRVGGLSVEAYAWRESVCERVVIGTETVEVPDPDAPKITQTVDKVEWRCGSLFAAAGEQ